MANKKQVYSFLHQSHKPATRQWWPAGTMNQCNAFLDQNSVAIKGPIVVAWEDTGRDNPFFSHQALPLLGTHFTLNYRTPLLADCINSPMVTGPMVTSLHIPLTRDLYMGDQVFMTYFGFFLVFFLKMVTLG